jgi:hypothetical protein
MLQAGLGMMREIAAIVFVLTLFQDAFASDKPIPQFSCAIVRLYVAKYSAPAAEAWARSRGATDVEVETARRCLGSDVQTASWTATSVPPGSALK